MSYKLFALASVFLSVFMFTGCGGGGSGSESTQTLNPNVSVTFVDLTGNIDPDGDGTVLITFSLDSNLPTKVSVEIQFSEDNGETYKNCTEDSSPTLGGSDNPTEGLTQLSANPGGSEHVFAWDSDGAGDLPDQNLNWLLVRIMVLGGGNTVSGYLTLLNQESDSTAPTLSGLIAEAVTGPSNDEITITFSEPVSESEAEDPANFTLQNPAGTPMTIPNGSTISYDSYTQKTSLILDGAGTANLQFGLDCIVTADQIHDLAGNEIEEGLGDEISVSVGGDGANLPGDQPSLELVYFNGVGGPQSGETLCMRFDEAMALNISYVFDNDDVDFWDGGDTIGSNSPIGVSLVDPYIVEITLGDNPQFTPNNSRIAVPDINDVITDLAGNVPFLPASPDYSDYIVVINFDESDPIMDQITLNDIPDILNGKGPAIGTLLVPRAEFEIDLHYHDVGAAGVDPESVEVFNDRAVTFEGSPLAGGTDLKPYLQVVTGDSGHSSLTVPNTLIFPIGFNTLQGRVSDLMGNTSDYMEITFKVNQPTNLQRPFETVVNPSQVWSLHFGRDLYTISISGTTYITVTATMVPNVRADFKDDLLLFGLNCASPIPVTGTIYDSNEFMRQEVIAAALDQLTNDVYSGANITFTDTNLGVLPGNNPQVPYNNFGHSIISVGGDSDIGALGVAFIDRANQNQDNDNLYNGSVPYNPGANLGVLTTRIFKYEVNASPFGFFRLTFDTFIPGRGVPVGEGAEDEAILMDIAGTGPAVSGPAAVRRDAVIAAIVRLGRFIAVLGGHEMGHSMGLSGNGAMPNGLYGGDAAHFPGSTSSHIDLTTFTNLFLLPAVNIMRPSTNFWYTNATGTRFNRLNLAYVREKVFYNP